MMKNIAEYFSPAEFKALRITSTFETGKPLNFGGLAGDFDGQGLSFGLLQWNIKSQTLQPLLKEFINLSPAKFAAIFGDHAESFRDLLLNKSPKEQIRFAVSINDSSNHVIKPWNSYFANLGKDPDMQAIHIRAAKTRLRIAAKYIPEFGFKTERAFVFLFDIVTQHGPNWFKIKKRDKLIAARLSQLGERRTSMCATDNWRTRTSANHNDEKAVMRVIAEILSATVKPAFAKNVLDRRNIIIDGHGTLGKRYFDLERDFGLSDDIIRS